MARNKYPEMTVERIVEAATTLFLEKGYDNTTIQDIVDALGDLSKGAIYHHFKSKEDMVPAVIEKVYGGLYRISNEIKSETGLTALEKLRKLFYISLENPSQKTVIKALPNLLKNPRFLAIQLDSTITELAPDFIEPLIREGMADGSIKTDSPKELAEVVALLSNIWINPMVFNCTSAQLYGRCMFFQQMMVGLGIDLFDQQMMTLIEHLGDLSSAIQQDEN